MLETEVARDDAKGGLGEDTEDKKLVGNAAAAGVEVEDTPAARLALRMFVSSVLKVSLSALA